MKTCKKSVSFHSLNIMYKSDLKQYNNSAIKDIYFGLVMWANWSAQWYGG